MPDHALPPHRIALTFVVLITILCVPGLFQIDVETDMTGSWTVPLTPSSVRYADYLDRFPPDNGAIVVVTGGLETEDRWIALDELTADLDALECVDRTESLTTSEYVRGDADGVEVINVLDLLPTPGAELTEIVRAYPPFENIFISSDGFATAVYIRAVHDTTPQEFTPAVQAVIDRHAPALTAVEGGAIFQGGEMRANLELANLTIKSTGLIFATIMVMFLVAAALSRSAYVGFIAGMTGGICVMITFAFMGYAGITLTPVNSLVVFMFVPLGAASVLHADAYIRHGDEFIWGFLPRIAIRPFIFATITTMTAFCATANSGYPDVQQFGLIGALGIAASLLVVIVFAFPLLTRRRSLQLVDSQVDCPAILRRTLKTSRIGAFVALAGFVAFSLYGLTQIDYSLGPIDYFVKGNEVLADFDRTSEHFGQNPVALVIFGEGEDSVLDPDLWQKLHDAIEELKIEFPGTYALWPYAGLSQLSLAFTAGEAAPQAFPDSPEMMAQYLLLFDEEDLESHLDWDRETLTIMFQTSFRSSSQYRPFRDRLNEFIAEHELDAQPTGRIPVFYDAGDKVAGENLRSIALGGAGIFLLLLVVSRSFTVALIAIAVNLLPVLGTLAFMGIYGVYLDIPMSFAAAIALGLVVDDTGHMVARYDVLRRNGDKDAHEIMVNEYWRPVFITSVTVVLGFAVMNFAEMTSFQVFSRIICVTMTCALIGDLVILPVLLKHFDRRRFVQ